MQTYIAEGDGALRRRLLLIALGSLGASTLAACSKDDPASEVCGDNHDKIVEALDTLSSAADDLGAAVGRFDDDNWREVVPDVKTAADNVSSAVADLKDLLANQD